MFTLDNFYKSDEWKAFIATLKIARVNDEGVIICEHCGKPIINKYDCIGHHKIHLTNKNVNDFNISLNPDNVILIHHRCHNQIHNRWTGWDGTKGHTFKKKRVYLVYGPPCSGKSSYVKEHATMHDLVLDIDKIWQCISTNDKYVKPNTLKSNVFQIRDCMFDMIKTRLGYWDNAFVIGGYPTIGERERIQRELGIDEMIYINTDKQTCLERASKSRPSEWQIFIENYFEKFQE